ncbi:right-handed parallel beta-helix repeat-containing protein [Actinospongicola halichondriae]|uniref:right-handed parallel beta-helix repeat-containing protein n=1 Tax=Actinospongicola halichondriae TaxID=3236844 RepID=UPI003D583EB3
MTKKPSATRTQRRAAERTQRHSAPTRAAMGGGAVLALGAGLVTGAAPAGAATFTVDTNSDTVAADGLTSLREAIDGASDGDTITFDPSVTGTITLSLGQITIDDAITVDGPGEDTLSISGNGASRIFYINAGGTVTIDGLTLEDGREGGSSGGAVRSEETDLTITDSRFEDNYANGSGGAVFIDGADLTVSGSTFYDNAAGQGGGVAVVNDGGTSVTDTMFDDNFANGNGGGMYVDESTGATFTNVTFVDNFGGSDGGGLFTGDNSAEVLITGSEFTDNFAGSDGGGATFEDMGADITIENTTVSGNAAPDDQAGGLFFYYADEDITITVRNSTITDNVANTGGGINFYSDDGANGVGTLRIIDTTVDGNEAYSDGGGVRLYAAGDLEIIGSTISNNSADTSGGGINVEDTDGETTIVNSTISGNQATYYGGGLNLSSSGDLSLLHSTITDNYSGGDGGGEGGGLYLRFTDAVIDHTIISGNDTDRDGPDIDINGDIDVSVSHSIIGEVSDPNGHLDDVTNNALGVTDPGLAPLADNGGPTFTHAILDGSPALDTGDPAFAAPPATDQRGESRVSGDGIDKGAYERQVAPPATTSTTSTTEPDDGVGGVGQSPPATPTVANPTFTG